MTHQTLPLILSIETSETICSVCLAQGSQIVAVLQHNEPYSHASILAVLIQKIFQENKLTIGSLNAVAISSGPGSYTGLRIGTSLAKGICYAQNIPLITIPTLKAMAFGLLKTHRAETKKYICPMIDARRMEVYTAVFNKNLDVVLKEQPFILNESSITIFDFEHTIFTGSGAQKILKLNPNAIIADNFTLNATHLISLAYTAFQNNEFADIAYFEPNYIKTFYSKAHTNAK